jgi:hypothetical protein
MRAFEVFTNGKRLCLAGIGDDGVLTAIVSFAATKARGIDDLRLNVDGLISPVHENVTWTNEHLNVGDEVTVRIVEVSAPDSPSERRRFNPADDLKNKKAYVRAMAKKFGWKVQPKPKRSPL